MGRHTAQPHSIARRSGAFLAGVMLATLAIVAIYAIGHTRNEQAPLALSAAQGQCLAGVMADVMTNEPEYPDDIAPRAAAVCGVQVIVSRDADGEVNARPVAILTTSLAGLR